MVGLHLVFLKCQKYNLLFPFGEWGTGHGFLVLRLLALCVCLVLQTMRTSYSKELAHVVTEIEKSQDL